MRIRILGLVVLVIGAATYWAAAAHLGARSLSALSLSALSWRQAR